MSHFQIAVLVAAGVLTLGAFVGKFIIPGMWALLSFIRKANAFFDTVAGREEGHDPVTGTAVPAVPALAVRLTKQDDRLDGIEESLALQSDALSKITEVLTASADHERRLQSLERVQQVLLAGTVERVATSRERAAAAESAAEMLRMVQAERGDLTTITDPDDLEM